MRRSAGPVLFGLFFIGVLSTGLIIGSYYPIAQQPTAGEANDGAQKPQPTPREWLTRDAAGFFTAGLVLVGVTQLALFMRQLRLIRDSLDDAKTAADASADAAKAAMRQAKVAEDLLSKKERPYLFVSGVRYIKKNEEFHSFYVDFSIGNYGAIPAIIEEAFFNVMPGKDEPDIPGYIGDWHSLVRDNLVSAGERRDKLALNIRHGLISGETGGDLIVYQKDGTQEHYPILSFDIEDDESVFCRIIIKYSGPFSRDHTVSAAWIYDPGMSEFIKWGGEKYNFYT